MSLVLEIEFLAGVSFAALGPESESADWPPQPDRIFSALVAAWAARGESADEAHCIEWLENQGSPHINASHAEMRSAPVAFVPPNDPRSSKASVSEIMPGMRRRQPRRFPAARPHDATLRLVWSDAEPDPETFSALERVARDVAYIGHSASLTRCRFVRTSEITHRGEVLAPKRIIYPGRLAELRRDFQVGRRPQPGAPGGILTTNVPERSNVFGEKWLLLEHVGEIMPDIRACALVARTIRETLLSGYKRAGFGAAIPELVSGHRADGKASEQAHVAIVPLPFAGFAHADGHVMGFALVPPHESNILEDPAFRQALRKIAEIDESRGRRIIAIRPREGTSPADTFAVELSPVFEAPANRRSLDPTLYTAPARDFVTITPIVLDRHLKSKGAEREAEIAELIARACRNIGLPDPELTVADKHSALEGIPSAFPSGNAPPWTRWRVPSSLKTRQLTHACIRFGEEVVGPVILGAGRFLGLGLCRPRHAATIEQQ